MLCTIWYNFFISNNVKRTQGGVPPLVKLKTYFTISNTPPWVFFTFLKLYKWLQIVLHITLKSTANDKVILSTVLK